MTVLSPPPQDELEALIREARARRRRRWIRGTTATAAVAALALAVHSVAVGGRSAHSTAANRQPAANASCGVAAGWRLRLGAPWSEATGQHTAPFVLIRNGATGCTLHGYPTIVLRDAAGQVLPFRFSHRGDQMVTGRPPGTVRVAAHRSAYFVFNKYRCDIRSQAAARLVQVQLPGVRGRLEVRLYRTIIDYCPAETPSRTIAVTPIVATSAAASAYP